MEGEGAVELDDVGVGQFRVDLEFSHKLGVSAIKTREDVIDAHLLRQFGGLHLGSDDLQSDCTAAKVLVAQQLRAMADGEASLTQLWSCLILQAFGVAHHLWRRLSVDGRGRHSKVWRSNVGCRGGVSAGVEVRVRAKQTP